MRPCRWQPTMLPRPRDFLGKNPGVGCHFLLHTCHALWPKKQTKMKKKKNPPAFIAVSCMPTFLVCFLLDCELWGAGDHTASLESRLDCAPGGSLSFRGVCGSLWANMSHNPHRILKAGVPRTPGLPAASFSIWKRKPKMPPFPQ